MPDDTYMKYRGKPFMRELNGFHLNSRGYKDGEFSLKKKGIFRIICIGDSQAYGAVPYPDCCLTILREKLKSIYPNSELLNMGVPAAGPVDYLSLLINEGLDLQPDLVLIFLYCGDDFRNGGKRHRWYSHSVAATFLNSLIANRWPPEGRMFAAGEYSEDRPLRAEKAYIKLMADSSGEMFLKNNNNKFVADFNSVIDIVSRIKALCDLRKIGVAVVLCPSDVQVYPEIRKKVMDRLQVATDQFDIQIPDRMLENEFSKLNIQFMDLSEYFSRGYNKDHKKFTQPNDPHWNRYGNAVAAEIIKPWLVRIVNGRMRREPALQKR